MLATQSPSFLGALRHHRDHIAGGAEYEGERSRGLVCKKKLLSTPWLPSLRIHKHARRFLTRRDLWWRDQFSTARPATGLPQLDASPLWHPHHAYAGPSSSSYMSSNIDLSFFLTVLEVPGVKAQRGE